jgi:hypothetical protein
MYGIKRNHSEVLYDGRVVFRPTRLHFFSLRNHRSGDGVMKKN